MTFLRYGLPPQDRIELQDLPRITVGGLPGSGATAGNHQA